jgi:hypothetical protein
VQASVVLKRVHNLDPIRRLSRDAEALAGQSKYKGNDTKRNVTSNMPTQAALASTIWVGHDRDGDGLRPPRSSCVTYRVQCDTEEHRFIPSHKMRILSFGHLWPVWTSSARHCVRRLYPEKTGHCSAWYEVLMAVTLKNAVFWDRLHNRGDENRRVRNICST